MGYAVREGVFKRYLSAEHRFDHSPYLVVRWMPFHLIIPRYLSSTPITAHRSKIRPISQISLHSADTSPHFFSLRNRFPQSRDSAQQLPNPSRPSSSVLPVIATTHFLFPVPVSVPLSAFPILKQRKQAKTSPPPSPFGGMLRTMAQHPPDHKPGLPSSDPSSGVPVPSPVSAPPSSSRSVPSSSTPPLFQPGALASPIAKGPFHHHAHHATGTASPYATAAAVVSASHLSPPAQSKWRVTPLQKEALLAAFHEDAYPELAKKTALAEQLGVTTTQISKWFQHRRESLTRLGQFKAQYNRTRRTPEELDVLQNAFDIDRYPTAEKLAELEAQLQGVTAKQIKLWFKHRRKQVQKRNRTSSTSPHTSPVLSPGAAVAADSIHSLPLVPRPQERMPVISDWQPTSSAGLLPALQHSAVQQPGLVQPAVSTSLAYPFAPHSYYAYKAPQVMLSTPSTFSDAELMALRGGQAVANGIPSAEALARLATLLNRPVGTLSEWFRGAVSKADGSSAGEVQNPVYMAGPYVQQSTDPARGGGAGAYQQQTSLGTGQAPNYTSSTGAGSHLQSENGASATPPLTNMPTGMTYEAGKIVGADDGKDTASASRLGTEKSEAFPASDVIHQVTPGAYPSYVYPAGVVPHPGVPFSPAPAVHASSASAPMLAPLRYVPASPNVQTYANPNQMWYSQAPSYSKG